MEVRDRIFTSFAKIAEPIKLPLGLEMSLTAQASPLMTLRVTLLPNTPLGQAAFAWRIVQARRPIPV